MKKIFLLTFSNLRKNKGQGVSLAFIVTLATIFLSLGLVVLTDLGPFLSERAEQLNAPHFVAIESFEASDDSRYEFIASAPSVTAMETKHVIAGIGGIYMGGSHSASPLLIADGMQSFQMNPLTLVGESLPLEGDVVYIPHSIFVTGGFALGDEITLELLGEYLSFTVGGSAQNIIFGATDVMIYVSSEQFERLALEFDEHQFRVLNAQLDEGADVWELINGYNDLFFGSPYNVTTFGSPLSFPVSQDFIVTMRVQFPTVIASLLTGFAFIILVVTVIVVGFRITATIEEGMTNIGVLKAMGYRSKEIIAALIFQFGGLSLIGILLGIGLSKIILAPFSTIFEGIIGLIWQPSLGVSLIVIISLSLLVIIVGFTYLSAKKVTKLQPLMALRSGLTTHNFKKNPLSLQAKKGSLPMQLGLKQLLQNKKQGFAVGTIVAGVLVVAIVGLMNFYNMSVNTDAFVEIVAGNNVPNVVMMNHEASPIFVDDLQEMDEVQKVYGAEFLRVFADEVLLTATVIESFDFLANNPLSYGRLPLHDNEIVVSPQALAAMNKKVGDWIDIRGGGNVGTFLVTGQLQSADHGGLSIMLTEASYLTLDTDFEFGMFNIHVSEGVDVERFIEDLESFGDGGSNHVINMQDQIDVMMAGVENIFELLAIVKMIVTGLIISTVLYMVIKTMIRRRRRDLGIQKALGFTTWQLMSQMTTILMPALIMGTALGTWIGYLGFNPGFVALMGGMGITESHFSIPLAWLILTAIAIVLFGYAMCLLMTLRIRKISPYELVTD